MGEFRKPLIPVNAWLACPGQSDEKLPLNLMVAQPGRREGTLKQNDEAEPIVQQSANRLPEVRALSVSDLTGCLRKGFADFASEPLFGLVFGCVFALAGIAIVLSITAWQSPWMIYPFAIGFPLVGPFAAVGLYEVSRRIDQEKPVTWAGILSVVWAQRRRELAWMAFVMLFVFWIWMYQVRLLIAIMLGRMSFSTFDKFITIVFTTPEGWMFLAVGHVVGAILALALFSITVISIPLLLEREIDIVSAMITSVKAVLASPVPMLGWGVFVTLAMIIGSAPIFLGIIFVLPILGHATWHIYRAAVVQAAPD